MYRKLHRSIGIGSFIFLFIFVMTGLAIQHTEWFDLDGRYIPSLLSSYLYGAKIQETVDYKTDNRWVSQAGSFLYIDGLPVSRIELNNLQGVVEDGTYIWIVGDNKLWLLSQSGEIVDRLSVLSGLPTVMRRIGYNQEGTIIIGSSRNNWLVDEYMQDWEIYSGSQIKWSAPVTSAEVPADLKEMIIVHANNHLVSWERALLDFHSGRLFGTVGVIIADFVALLLLFLSATGVFLWLKKA